MSVDLQMLVWSVALAIVQMLISVGFVAGQVDQKVLVGNREDMPKLNGFAHRAQRAHLNMLENLLPFAALILVVHVTGKAGALTALAAQIFFWSRAAFAVIFVAGIPWLRTLAFLGGIAALVILLKVLLIG